MWQHPQGDGLLLEPRGQLERVWDRCYAEVMHNLGQVPPSLPDDALIRFLWNPG